MDTIKKDVILTTEDNIYQQSTSPNQKTDDKNHGLTAEEVLDPNKIQVTISDPAPIVVLFGARASGKTMALVRLTRYLKKKGYKVEPDKIFRRSNSTYYEKMCSKFDESISSDVAAATTNILSFMLVKVMDKWGKPICQILEAPGEHYFDDKNIKMPFPRYINSILHKSNAKTWVFIVENDWKDDTTRNNYANKIVEMQSLISHNDKVIFLCHKSDLSPHLINRGNPNDQQFFANIKNQYPGIFTQYLNKNPITRLFKPHNFDFVVFSAGTFNDCNDGSQSYEQSVDKYPATLWNGILKTVKGNMF